MVADDGYGGNCLLDDLLPCLFHRYDVIVVVVVVVPVATPVIVVIIIIVFLVRFISQQHKWE